MLPFLALAAGLTSCGGETRPPDVVASIVVPTKAATRTQPGGHVSLEGECSNAREPATHAWDIPGGSPSTSAAKVPGVVTFASAGTYTVSYRCTGADGKTSPTDTRTISVADPGPSLLHIQPQYLSSQAQLDLGPDLDAAVALLTSVVTGPLPGFEAVEPPWDACGNVTVASHVGEIVVLVSVEPIDGPMGMVARSSPCYIRKSDGLPYVGLVKVDSADVATLTAQGKLRPMLLHELMHVLGFGMLWDQPGLPLLLGGGGTSNPYFVGPNAGAAFQDFNGGAGYPSTPVPLENMGTLGDGSRERHWRTSIFGNELMTSYLGSASPVSRTTLEAFVDQGWQVNAELADPFLVTTSSFGALLLSPADQIDLGDDALPIVPRYR
jgi:PKD repeat protein